MESKLGAIVAKNIRSYRESRGLTQAALAEKINTTPGHVGPLERHEREPSFATIERLCAALNITVAQLFLQESKPGTAESELARLVAFLSGRSRGEIMFVTNVAAAMLSSNSGLTVKIPDPQ